MRVFQRFPTIRRGVSVAALLAAIGAGPASAAGLALKGDISTARDMLTLGDLVADAPPALAATPLFRAPMLGQTGTIQVRRIESALEALGLPQADTGGRFQVTVTRSARKVSPAEIERALRQALARQYGLDVNTTGVRFEGHQPQLLTEPQIDGDPQVTELVYDPRSRRLAATIFLGPNPGERLAQTRIGGTAIDLVDVATLARAMDKGDPVRSADITVEKKPRDSVPAEAVFDGWPLEGRVTRRPLASGTYLRQGDLIRPELVAKNDMVTVVYEVPGVALSLRGKANEAGAMGDTVSVLNLMSKKTVQAVIVGPGRVSVSAAGPGRLAVAQ